MATISALLGSMIGFFVGLADYALFDASLLQALFLWSATGVAALFAGLILPRMLHVGVLVRA